jgi:hypothetical protein
MESGQRSDRAGFALGLRGHSVPVNRFETSISGHDAPKPDWVQYNRAFRGALTSVKKKQSNALVLIVAEWCKITSTI